MSILDTKNKYHALFKKELIILLVVLFVWAALCGGYIALFLTRTIRMVTAITFSGFATAAVGVFTLAFCTLKLVPNYRTYRVFLEATGGGITKELSFTVDGLDENTVTRQGVDYYIVSALERKLLFIASEPIPSVGSNVMAVLLGNTVVEWSEKTV